MANIITLTTDFGTKDAYVAAVKAVILSINPNATIVDLCHVIEPQNVAQGAYVFGSAYKFFPQNTIHVVVVDPGVGSRRRAIALQVGQSLFVGPDNGVFAYVYHDLTGPVARKRARDPFHPFRIQLPADAQAVVLTKSEFWRYPPSRTFHGRDIFAPVAAHLSCGVALQAMGRRPATRVTTLSIPQPFRRPDGSLQGHVVHVDRFGNIITNIPERSLRGDVTVEIGSRQIGGVSRSYSEAADLLAIVGSNNTLEIALKGGSAARTLKAGVGTEVLVWRAKDRKAR